MFPNDSNIPACIRFSSEHIFLKEKAKKFRKRFTTSIQTGTPPTLHTFRLNAWRRSGSARCGMAVARLPYIWERRRRTEIRGPAGSSRAPKPTGIFRPAPNGGYPTWNSRINPHNSVPRMQMLRCDSNRQQAHRIGMCNRKRYRFRFVSSERNGTEKLTGGKSAPQQNALTNEAAPQHSACPSSIANRTPTANDGCRGDK